MEKKQAPRRGTRHRRPRARAREHLRSWDAREPGGAAVGEGELEDAGFEDASHGAGAEIYGARVVVIAFLQTKPDSPTPLLFLF